MRTKQIAFSTSVRRLLPLAGMSEAIGGLPPPVQMLGYDLSSALDNMQVFLSREKAEPSLNIPRRRYSIPIKRQSIGDFRAMSKLLCRNKFTIVIREVNAGAADCQEGPGKTVTRVHQKTTLLPRFLFWGRMFRTSLDIEAGSR